MSQHDRTRDESDCNGGNRPTQAQPGEPVPGTSLPCNGDEARRDKWCRAVDVGNPLGQRVSQQSCGTDEHQCRRGERKRVFVSDHVVAEDRHERDREERHTPQNEEERDRDVVRTERGDEPRSGVESGQAIEPDRSQYPRDEASIVRQRQRPAIEGRSVFDVAV